VDAAVLVDVRRHGDVLPRPPAELCGGERVSSVWDFALVAAVQGEGSGPTVLQRRVDSQWAKRVAFVETR
jgi:hypothetical protein